MATLVWTGNGGLRYADLPREGTVTVGRSVEAQVMVEHGTVSRIHARVIAANGAYQIENLSRTNTIIISGKEVAASKLKDGDSVELGVVRLVFCDLTAVVVKGRLLCPHCQRINELTRKDCWFCGENLVNATISRLPTTRASCAVVNAAGLRAVGLEGEQTPPPGIGAGTPPWLAEGRPDGPWLRPGPGVSVNDEPAPVERPLRHGDRVAAGGEAWLILVPA